MVIYDFVLQYLFLNVAGGCGPHQVVVKAGSPERITWSMELMVDFLTSGAMKPDQLGVRYLGGQIAGSGGKGVVDLLCLKKDVLHYIMNDFMDSHTYTIQERTLLRETAASIDVFREKCGYANNISLKKATSCARRIHI